MLVWVLYIHNEQLQNENFLNSIYRSIRNHKLPRNEYIHIRWVRPLTENYKTAEKNEKGPK